MDIQQAHAYAARELRKVESYLSYLEEGSHAEA